MSAAGQPLRSKKGGAKQSAPRAQRELARACPRLVPPRERLVPGVGVEPTRLSSVDFESTASANSATRATGASAETGKRPRPCPRQIHAGQFGTGDWSVVVAVSCSNRSAVFQPPPRAIRALEKRPSANFLNAPPVRASFPELPVLFGKPQFAVQVGKGTGVQIPVPFLFLAGAHGGAERPAVEVRS